MARRAKAVDSQNVEGARLEVLRLAVLPAQSKALDVIDASGAALGVAPQEAVPPRRCKHRIRVAVTHSPYCRVEVARVDERAGALEKNEDIDVAVITGEGVEGVQQGAF